ncbi:MAG: hypothetical protein COB37_07165 [Kordiimonadales bacterium]|nr:MAG: hypothetical protein COB37_07165 [Kordiimonadales bacterium]
MSREPQNGQDHIGDVEETGADMPNWDELQDVWQDTPPVDMAELARNAKFVWWRMRINFVLEVAGSLTVAAISMIEVDFASLSSVVFFTAFLLFGVAALWAAVHVREGAWGSAGEDAEALIDLQINRAKSTIRYIKVNNWLSVSAFLLVPLAYWNIFDGPEQFDEAQMRVIHWAYGAVMVFVVGFPLVTRNIIKSKRREIEHLGAVKAQLADA